MKPSNNSEIDFLEGEISALQLKIMSPFRTKPQRREDERRLRDLRDRLNRLAKRN
jgi:hypothetical protein